jgi:hypothetical protein
MKYAVEIGSGVMIYVYTKFHEDWLWHSKVYRADAETHRQQGDLISLL